jgi:hypothetical protein
MSRRMSFSHPKLWQILLTLIMLATYSAALMANRAWADEATPFKGNFTVAVTFIPNVSGCGSGDNCIACLTGNPPGFYIEAQGIGDASKQGTFFLKIQKCLNPAASTFGSYQGVFTMTAPNGKDTLTGTYIGKNTAGGNAYGFGSFNGDLKITGGTGKFDEAYGHLHFTAVAGSNTGAAFYAVEGEVFR